MIVLIVIITEGISPHHLQGPCYNLMGIRVSFAFGVFFLSDMLGNVSPSLRGLFCSWSPFEHWCV